MSPLLLQFLSESRDCLQGISEKLIQLEDMPDDAGLMAELFRLVHTQKGNCGMFDFPEMLRVLHAAEDLMTVVRDGKLDFSRLLADALLESMDFVGLLLDEIESSGTINVTHADSSVRLAALLRQLIPPSNIEELGVAQLMQPEVITAQTDFVVGVSSLIELPASLRKEWSKRTAEEPTLLWISYTPEPGCFFKGEDPFFQARRIPLVLWQRVTTNKAWAPLAEFDAYECKLVFQLVSAAGRAEIEEHFRYVPEQVSIKLLETAFKELPEPESDNVFVIAIDIIEAQYDVLSLPDEVPWLAGRLRAVAATLKGCFISIGRSGVLTELDAALELALKEGSAIALLNWLGTQNVMTTVKASVADTLASKSAAQDFLPAQENAERNFGRRVEDMQSSQGSPKTLKVDQEKIDRLMNLIGEMVVAKNSLPYLAVRAEAVHGVRELAREIKLQYGIINRIAEEMQDAIMQVRMMPVSFVFQRFPRLVRDVSRKLGKEVVLILEGEHTEADKNIIEALADPLIHIVRNSLDHGLEMPDIRRLAGKPNEGRLTIRASQESDRVVIDISDDGKGIDPSIIKHKAYEKGIIDEAMLERISDQEAINLVFAAGFSTAEVVSDLSGRGVGMDVVRAAVEQVNGTVSLQSKVGEGTRLRLSLPLSMAVTNVIIVESNTQLFGVPMDTVVETVRVPRTAVRSIKNHETTVLRGRIVPLRSLNAMFATDKSQRLNGDDELAVLVVRMSGEHVGIVVDDFREVIDIILKPLSGVLGNLPGYAGSALMGDGSVLMILNPEELM